MRNPVDVGTRCYRISFLQVRSIIMIDDIPGREAPPSSVASSRREPASFDDVCHCELI